ncbi:hypothetical protein MQM1_045 [Aeromonas phage vB_AsaP_MQM1]|nr:hypothetical protein MQM1_045 [Aeromonas phage vB_AsaP_MQM1]
MLLDEEAIKADYATGLYSWNSLASKHNTSKRTVGRILHGIHLPRKTL